MATFEERDKKFENKFAHDKELQFKASARRNKLLGQWAAAKLGLSGDAVAEYARATIEADFEHEGDEDVLKKVLGDFQKASLPISAQDIRVEMDRLMLVAKEQIMSEVK